MKTVQKVSSHRASNTFFALLVFMIIIYIATAFYWMSRPVYAWWECFINPLACASQYAYDTLVALIGQFTSPIYMVIIAIIAIVLRLLKR